MYGFYYYYLCTLWMAPKFLYIHHRQKKILNCVDKSAHFFIENVYGCFQFLDFNVLFQVTVWGSIIFMERM